MKVEVKEFLENKSSEIKMQMNDISIDFAYDWRLNDINYLGDCMNEYADGHIDIYYDDLQEWLRNDDDSIEYMERVVEEELVNTKTYDFYNHIQVAQYYQLTDKLGQDEGNILVLLTINYLLDNDCGITLEQAEELVENAYSNEGILDDILEITENE